VLEDLNPLRARGVPLGYDRRWIFPVLPTTAVSDATTSVQYLRQSARTLAGTAVIRPLDATSAKPETSSTVEFKVQQLEQVATISRDIPRIHAAQPMFQRVIEQDLRLSIGDGLDEVVRRGIAQAGTIVKGTDDILEVTRKAMTLIEAEGYSPDTLAIDPGWSSGARPAPHPWHREVLHLGTGPARGRPVESDPSRVEVGRHGGARLQRLRPAVRGAGRVTGV
jgi:hypothetical protein